MGPPGLLIGATAGGFYAYRQNRGDLDKCSRLSKKNAHEIFILTFDSLFKIYRQVQISC